MKWYPKNWRDILALQAIVLFPVELIYVYANGIPLPEIVVGGFMGVITTAAIFYWRKANTEG